MHIVCSAVGMDGGLDLDKREENSPTLSSAELTVLQCEDAEPVCGWAAWMGELCRAHQVWKGCQPSVCPSKGGAGAELGRHQGPVRSLQGGTT